MTETTAEPRAAIPRKVWAEIRADPARAPEHIAGLAALRQGGATTIGQDEATSLVYGMPRAAWELGAVEQRLPLSQIAQAALRAARREAVR